MQADYWRVTLSWLPSYLQRGGQLSWWFAPPVAQTLHEYAQALDSANLWGWAAVMATEAIVCLSGALLIY